MSGELGGSGEATSQTGYWYAKGVCPVCYASTLGFVVGSDGRRVLLLCCECDACYQEPAPVGWEQATFPSSPAFFVEELGCSVKFPEARWATQKEIEDRGWGEFVGGYYPGRAR
jgi:hypothetical protein